MKTLADFKRLPIGTKILTIQGADRYKGTVREIVHKQTNAIKFQGGSWLEYPKASNTIINGNNIIIKSSPNKYNSTGNDILEYAIYIN